MCRNVKVQFGDKEVVFSSKPLGLRFQAKQPIVIRGFDPDSPGEGLGVTVGMTLTGIAGQDITEMSFREALFLIQKSLKDVPEKL